MNELIFFSEFKLPKKLKFSKTRMKKNNLIKIFVFIKKKEKNNWSSNKEKKNFKLKKLPYIF